VRWTIKNKNDAEVTKKLALDLNVDQNVAQLLAQRDLTTFELAKEFFRPSLDKLHDPFLMKDMDLAVSRIISAIEQNQKILVYGDYDVDGTTAVSLIYSYLISIEADAGFYVPDRYGEGYGISFKGIDYAAENNYQLIIALDCGIKSNDKIDYASNKNIDFIICDHHLPGEDLPKAIAVLDPKRNDCPYPYKELSGCGIGFKLAQALSIKLKKELTNQGDYLQLAAVSIAADIVPITGENRVLCYYGLQQIQKKPLPGIASILNQNKLKKDLTVTDLVFIIAPRINAAGRIDHASKSIELLLSKDISSADVIASKINEHNLTRRELDQAITAEAISMIEGDKILLAKKSTVVFNKTWHKGVVGIVASRLVEKFYRPTIVLTESDGKITGSARSVKGFDVHQAIDSCSYLLEQFGGHKYAAGLTLKPENLNEFISKFEEVLQATITDELLIPEQIIDLEISLIDISPKFFNIIKQLSPHGPENMAPIFVARNVYDTGWAKVVGTNHLKAELFQEENPEIKFEAIGFDLGDYLNAFQKRIPVDLCFSIDENEWNNVKKVQLVLKGIKSCLETQ